MIAALLAFVPRPSLLGNNWPPPPDWLPIPAWMPGWLAVAWYGRWHQDATTGEWLLVTSANKRLGLIEHDLKRHRAQRILDELLYLKKRAGNDIQLIIWVVLLGYGGSWGFLKVDYYAEPVPNIGWFLATKVFLFIFPALFIFTASFGFCSLVSTRLSYATGGQHMKGAKVLDPEPSGRKPFGPSVPVTPASEALDSNLAYRPNA